MAEYRLTGEAFAGTVTAAEPDRLDTDGQAAQAAPADHRRHRRPGPVEPGATLASPARPAQKARVVGRAMTTTTPGTQRRGRRAAVVLELSGGMGRALTAAPGSVPEVGERVCYTTLTDDYQPPGSFPAARRRRGRTAARRRSTSRPTRTPPRPGHDGRDQPSRNRRTVRRSRGRRLADWRRWPPQVADRRPRRRHRGVVVDSPPGAGKSALVVRAAADLAAAGEPVMVVAQTNEQVDDLVDRLATAGAGPGHRPALGAGLRARRSGSPGTRT